MKNDLIASGFDARIFRERWLADDRYMCWGCRAPSRARAFAIRRSASAGVLAQCPRCGAKHSDPAHAEDMFTLHVERLRAEQCEKCKMPGCDRGPGFADVADRPPSMWKCPCQCHPVNRCKAAQFLSDHVSRNHGRVLTTSRETSADDALLTCECGQSVTYASSAIGAA